jgi:hypothetical protein
MPQLEDCDVAQVSDRDCDGDPINGFDLDTDVRHCGGCGQACPVVDNAIEACSGGDCFIAACEEDFWDNDGVGATGCEYGPCEFQGAEDCNLADDDCDGQVNEDMFEPAICRQVGECAGTTPSCVPAVGWVCDYGPTVSTDADGAIVPESTCDGLDNDCDGATDEPFPLVGLPCDDGEEGECRDAGFYQCNAAGTAVECSEADDEVGVGTESCNGLDDDCDGDTDEGDLNAWVDVGGFEIFAYEASRPDADADEQGSLGDRPCSKPDALPWTNISHDAAEAQCQAVGARLCTEAEWEQACETNQSFGLPDSVIVFEAESGTATAGCTDSWSVETDIAGYSGTGFMFVGTDDGNNYSGISCTNANCGTACSGGGSNGNASNAVVRGARLSYTVDFPTAGTWYVWLRGYGNDNNDNSVHAGLNGAGQAALEDLGDWPDEWIWINHDFDSVLNLATLTVPSAGVHTFNLFQREDGFRIDRILLTSDPDFAPPNPGPDEDFGCTWSYDGDCITYEGDTCNGDDYDADGATTGDQDALLPTGELAACFADWGAAGQVWDMSGNVKEWTAQRGAAVNPIRGGSYNNTANGISCQFDFLTADDAFLFENVGFRCCR